MTAEIRPFLKEHIERSIQKNALRLLPWYLELLLHSYFTENERMRATATFFYFFPFKSKKKRNWEKHQAHFRGDQSYNINAGLHDMGIC